MRRRERSCLTMLDSSSRVDMGSLVVAVRADRVVAEAIVIAVNGTWLVSSISWCD